MESRKDIVEFSIARVTTEQFAIIEKSFADTEAINLNTNLRFALDRNQRIVAVFALFKFEQKGIPFLLVEVSCQFLIVPESWTNFIKDDITTIIPKGFMTHLGMITVGTARGVLHTKTEGTRFNDFVLPTINVVDMIKEDVSFIEANSSRLP
jgi:hypothetical protein